jgi:hypothetical protein
MAALFVKMKTVFTGRSNSKFENVPMCQYANEIGLTTKYTKDVTTNTKFSLRSFVMHFVPFVVR